ncbi:uncharacterized protein LOC142321802 isoform X2 [Lycorma delicatula]|uniref:uncharacterized protein LOC142321802 isoform X2 n=1 Tax=Lycorma delicatula TaxID=130591 RepID=UPI003F50FCCA
MDTMVDSSFSDEALPSDYLKVEINDEEPDKTDSLLIRPIKVEVDAISEHEIDDDSYSALPTGENVLHEESSDNKSDSESQKSSSAEFKSVYIKKEEIDDDSYSTSPIEEDPLQVESSDVKSDSEGQKSPSTGFRSVYIKKEDLVVETAESVDENVDSFQFKEFISEYFDTVTNERRFRCGICQKSFTQKGADCCFPLYA